MDVSSERVYPGDSVKVTCRITSTSPADKQGSVDFVVHWSKKIPGEEEDTEMSANMYPNDGFDIPRYTFSHNMEDDVDELPDVLEFYLDISGEYLIFFQFNSIKKCGNIRQNMSL